jgi:hypothetical protein
VGAGVRSKVLLTAAITALALTTTSVEARDKNAASPIACPALYPGGVVPFSGLFPAIEDRMAISNFEPHQIVEIDFVTMPEKAFREHVAELRALPARVSIYLPGGHCNIENKDCAKLTKAGVKLGTTGSWNWDKDERRILNIDHPASIERLAAGAELGWRLGANYIRVDNLHYPAGSKAPRTVAQMKRIFDAIHDVEDRMRIDGTIPQSRPTGVVAHNNLDVWEQLVREGNLRRPPVFLTSERTAQLAFKGQSYKGDAMMKEGRLDPSLHEEITAGRRLALGLGVPYSIAEFRLSHDLGGKRGAYYALPQSYVDAVRKLPGVTEIFVIPNESQYVGRGRVYQGEGPVALAAAPFPSDAGRIAAACMRE